MIDEIRDAVVDVVDCSPPVPLWRSRVTASDSSVFNWTGPISCSVMTYWPASAEGSGLGCALAS